MSDDEPWGNLGFEEAQARFESPSQNARVWTEGWVARSLFCPSCGADTISQFPANRQVADFECRACREEYELKAQKGRFGAKVLDGAYGAMLRRLEAANNPNLLLMNYDAAKLSVTDLFVVPKHFFTPGIIEPKKPLASTAAAPAGRAASSASTPCRPQAGSRSCATASSCRSRRCSTAGARPCSCGRRGSPPAAG
ncbi:MAG TPA: DpnI domain-containing protein [Caulobacteraceae bacterium]|jgi:type II restriction enzyme